MDGLDKHGAEGAALLEVGVLGLENLALKEGNDLLDVPGVHQSHADVEDLLANVGVRGRNGPEDVHEDLLEDLGVLPLELLEALQDNHLDVVVVLGGQEGGVGGGRSADGGGGGGERDESPCRLV